MVRARSLESVSQCVFAECLSQVYETELWQSS